METIKQKLIASLMQRIASEIAPQNPVKFLADPMVNIEDLVDASVGILYLYSRTGRGVDKKMVLMTEVISAIGHGVRTKYKLKKDSAIAAKAGAFVLYSFEAFEIIKVILGKAGNGHQTYVIEIINEEELSKMWDSLHLNKTEKLPSETPYCPWTDTKHVTGVTMVKTSSKDVLKELTPETHPLVFNCLNKAQAVGWKINEDIYPIYTWALRNKTDAFADIWEMHNPEAKQSKIREAKAIGSIASRFIGKVFFHLYYYDFRGRKYPATAYLHEQGTDLAKGLLLRADSKSIGEQGYFWLLISIASNWAGDAGRLDGYKTDKIPLNDRVYWVLDNEEIILSYAESPKVNQGWMQADKPWQFLSACMELKKLREWQDAHVHQLREVDPTDSDDWDLLLYNYESHLECYIDGSNNGSQHLSALTRDEVTAPHVNLVPSPLPGDLYKYVADHVWRRIELAVSEMSATDVEDCENLIDNLADFKRQISEAPLKSDRRKELITEIMAFKKSRIDLIAMACPVYWNRIKDGKHRRKIVKRNIMTLPYGGTAYGLGQQQIDDARKHGIEQLFAMEHKWGSYMGREVYEDCRVSLKRPMQLLSVFEAAGKAAETAGQFLSWKVPGTGFPVTQHYTEGTVKKIWVQYGPPVGIRNSTGYYENTFQLAICFLETTQLSKKKQSQGASPNAIHSLDAAHLTIAVNRADFPVTTIHDSFGCLLGDMADLFVIIRESFVELYSHDPLTSIMRDINGDVSKVEMGNLDINLILDSEYAFA
jgi:DNA-directed RNA polymerase